jgi:formimidoylglutamase
VPESTFSLDDLRNTPDPLDPRADSLLRGAPAGDEPVRGRPVLLGLPYDGGIPSRPGARFGPRALREALGGFGTFDGTRELADGGGLLDLGDLALPSTSARIVHARAEEAARRVWTAGAVPVFVGGDHGLTGSLVRGLAAARPRLQLAIVSIDAHLDVRDHQDPEIISSGTPFRRALDSGIVEGHRIAMLGLRPFANSRYHTRWVMDRGVFLAGVDEIAARGAAFIAAEALERVAADADALYLSVDLDAADASVAPGVSAAGVGGLAAREMIDLVRTVARDSRLVGADLMELSPPFDQGGRTARLAARLLLEILAQRPAGR